MYEDQPPFRLTGQPYLKDEAHKLSLHFDFVSIQSAMDKANPTALTLGYTRGMMGFLLFTPEPEAILMIGLGGGSMAKYCHRHLPATHFTSIEINPDVIALRERFQIPPDDEHFQIVCADGASYLKTPGEPVDVLLLDGFNLHGHPPALCSTSFYQDCHARLQPDGLLVTNLWGGDPLLSVYVNRLRECFNQQVILINAEDEGNKLAFAWKGPPPTAKQLTRRASELSPAHPINLPVTAQKIAHCLRQDRCLGLSASA